MIFHSLNLTSIWHRKQLSKCDLGIKHCHFDKPDVPHMKPELLRWETKRKVYLHLHVWIFPHQYYFFNNVKKDETRGFQGKKNKIKWKVSYTPLWHHFLFSNSSWHRCVQNVKLPGNCTEIVLFTCTFCFVEVSEHVKFCFRNWFTANVHIWQNFTATSGITQI